MLFLSVSGGQEEVHRDSKLFETRIQRSEMGVDARVIVIDGRLSEKDGRPPCKTCKEKSEFYCNMNDEYFCTIHVVGHDENEF